MSHVKPNRGEMDADGTKKGDNSRGELEYASGTGFPEAGDRTGHLVLPRFVAVVLTLYGLVLGYSATTHSPTDLEPAFLVSGLYNWRFQAFELYRVNPPLVRMIAAMPVALCGAREDWTRVSEEFGARPEFRVAEDFLKVNGARSIWLFTLARWACIPFAVLGAYVCTRWSTELYGVRAGICTLFLYVCEPTLLAHSELITPDAGASAVGLFAGYSYWRWLRQGSWAAAAAAGGALGLAQLCKMTWIVLYVAWPVIWAMWAARAVWGGRLAGDLVGNSDRRSIGTGSAQLVGILAISLYVLNLGYSFSESGTRLREFEFVSRLLRGHDYSHTATGNRFRDSWCASLPVPLPKQYVLGIDAQQRDFESFRLPAYLHGHLKQDGGWWYYYAYCAAVKIPCGMLFMCVVAVWVCWRRYRSGGHVSGDMVLLAPVLLLFVCASMQTEVNRHYRYVLPCVGAAAIFAGQAAAITYRKGCFARGVVCACLLECVIGTLAGFPHQLAYFNGLAGGWRNGHLHVLGSSLDWGQDLLFIREAVDRNDCDNVEFVGGYYSRELVRAVMPNVTVGASEVRRLVIRSPNCIESGVVFVQRGEMVTPTVWMEVVEGAVRD